MGRRKLWAERTLLSLAEGTLARIDAVLAPGEARLDFIRTAIARELRRRERRWKVTGGAEAAAESCQIADTRRPEP